MTTYEENIKLRADLHTVTLELEKVLQRNDTLCERLVVTDEALRKVLGRMAKEAHA